MLLKLLGKDSDFLNEAYAMGCAAYEEGKSVLEYVMKNSNETFNFENVDDLRKLQEMIESINPNNPIIQALQDGQVELMNMQLMVRPEYPYEDISEAIMGDKTAHKKRDVNNVLHHSEEDKRKPAAKNFKKKRSKDSKKITMITKLFNIPITSLYLKKKEK